MEVRKNLLIIAVTLVLAACSTPEERAASYLASAQKLFDEGDLVKANLDALNASQLEPKNAKARYLLALIAEEKQEYRAMIGHLQVAVDSDPAALEARLKLATIYLLGQEFEEAGQLADEAMKIAPNDPRVRLLHGRVLLQKNDRTGGLAEVAKVLEMEPENVDAILLQATVEATEGIDDGIRTLDAAIARLPPDKSRMLRTARIQMLTETKRTAEVETSLRSLAGDFPDEQEYQVQLAQFYASQGRVGEAEKLLQKYTELDPEDADRQLSYVQFLQSQGDTARVEAALKTFIEKNPDAGQLRLSLAELYEVSGRADEARKVYAELGEETPRSTEGLIARNRVAALDVRAGKLAEGEAEIDRILTDAPDNAAALLLRAGLRFSDSRFDETIADVRLVLRREPANERALLLLAQTYARKNELTLAKDSYRRLLEVSPDSSEGLQQLAALYAAEKEYSEAESLLRKRLAGQPDDLLAAQTLVEILMIQGQVTSAETEARRMAALPNQAGIGDFSLGRVLSQKKDFNGAAEAFGKSVAARDGDPKPLEGLVRALLAGGKKDEAISTLKGQLDSSENRLFAKFLLGGVYGQVGDQVKAATYLEEAVQETPDNVAAWSTLADLYKEREKRIAVYQRAVTAAPANVQLNMLLASEYELAGRFDDAIGLYEGLLKTSPTHEPAVNNLAALLLDHRSDKASHDRALELSKSLPNTDENPVALDTLGWAHYRVGQYPEAVSVLERVVARAGQVPVFRYHLGMAYLRAGNSVGAKQELRKAVENTQGDYPGLTEARATLDKLDKSS